MNIALGIEYSGSNYCGWQRQSHSPSVQQSLEVVLSKIANHSVSVFCAGRTDTGVHATAQVVSFQLNNERPLRAWELGANSQLPDDICVRWAKPVPDEFHARHSAFARRYRYVIQNTRYCSAILSGKVTWYRTPLNHELMHQGAQALIGENNFSSFQASSCQSPTPFRRIDEISVNRYNEFVIIDVRANAFLHHMVRNIVGCLVEVGFQRQPVEFVQQVLAVQDRTAAPMTAKPDGLYLVQVAYPEKYQIPQLPLGPLTLPQSFL
ncbi:tRNA pseudouridine(38-40) synthase TruA [Aliikangiella maris]|uniref:tRNA pseudouridine synthase A n=2 Tax=Aliikangiella maris TaxID=3162458 RepID=A0ABV3MLX3_9GAMM